MPSDPSVEIRKIDSFPDLDACVELQQSVWQFRDLDVLPRRMFVVARAVGGQIFGAWDGSCLAGYLLAVPGVRAGRPYLHSHMLAIAPEYRNRGIGAQLKWAQREDALARGIDRIEWTFDPLQSKNAYFNIEKLGAIARRYTPDFYGASASPVHRAGALPTDRLHAEWWLKSRRVEALAAGASMPEYPIQETIAVVDSGNSPSGPFGDRSASSLECLLTVRKSLQAAFANRLTVLRFRSGQTEAARYLLGTLPPQELD